MRDESEKVTIGDVLTIASELMELGGSWVLLLFRILIVWTAYQASLEPSNKGKADYKIAIIVGMLAIISSYLIQ